MDYVTYILSRKALQVSGDIAPNDYYKIKNVQYKPITDIVEEISSSTAVIDLSIIEQEKRNTVYWNNVGYNLVQIKYGDKTDIFFRPTDIVIDISVSANGSTKTVICYVGDGKLTFKHNIADDSVSLTTDSIVRSSGLPTDIVKYTEQTLTDEQKSQARENLDLYRETLDIIDTAEVTFVDKQVTHYLPLNNAETCVIELINSNRTIIWEGNVVKSQTGPEDFSYEVVFSPTTNNVPSTEKLHYTDGLFEWSATSDGTDGTYTMNTYNRTVTTVPTKYIQMDDELLYSSKNPVKNYVIKTELDKKMDAPETASVGQIIAVKRVNLSGKPMEWEAVDLPKKMVVNFSGDGTEESPYVCDKTHSELYSAYYDGYEISAIFTGMIDGTRYNGVRLSLYNEPMPVFEFVSFKNIVNITLDDTGLFDIYTSRYDTDESLTKYGRPADAWTVGNRFKQLEMNSDWEQNDETQLDYIKNRPFYENITQEDIITEQTKNFSYNSSNNCYSVYINDKKYLSDGYTCKVLWDGTVYDMLSKTGSYPSCPYFGDKDFIEYPFYFVLDISQSTGDVHGYSVYTNDTSASHTFRVYTEESNVKCIDKKFIPDDYINELIERVISFNSDGELVVTLNGVSKTFVAKTE